MASQAQQAAREAASAKMQKNIIGGVKEKPKALSMRR
jgi:hypothetical protein